MTRINLIDPTLLTDQHLFAEYREITRIPKLVENALQNKSIHEVLKKIPDSYRLSTGHVLFFYDKLDFIEQRYFALRDEVLKRQFNITLKDSIVDYRQHIPHQFYQTYQPNPQALAISIQRIIEKINDKPVFYRLYSEKIDAQHYIQQLTQFISR